MAWNLLPSPDDALQILDRHLAQGLFSRSTSLNASFSRLFRVSSPSVITMPSSKRPLSDEELAAPPPISQSDDRPPQRRRYEDDLEFQNASSSYAAEPQANASLNHPTILYPNVKEAKLDVKQTPFQLPTQIMSFSHDEQHAQRFDNSALRYYVGAPAGARLDYGYDRWIRKPDERGRLDGLLNALRELKKDPARASTVPENGVVCWRGIMTKILTAPYEERDGWELNIMSINGALYFEEHLTDARLQEKNDMSPRQRLQSYYGYSFESYCTSDSPSRPVDAPRNGWGGDVNTNVQWCSVVRTKLGDTRVVIGGEVDCVKGKYTGRTDTFVELKTSLAIRGQHDETRFEKKLLKFYFQSFLLGVPEIVVGFRTPAGIVTTSQTFKTVELPRLVRGKPEAWNPLVCLEWGDQFLQAIKKIVQAAESENASSTRSVWRATFAPGTGVTVRVMDQSGVDEVVNGEDRIGLLPRWYWSEVQETREEVRGPPPDMNQKTSPAQPV